MSGRSMLVTFCAAVLLAALTATEAVAQVTVTAASGSYAHGGTLTIQGRGFGQKTPAAPLLWDDGEDRRVNDPAAVPEKGWRDPWPAAGPSQQHLIQYRSAPFRNTAPPHAFSAKYLTGGHYQEADNDPPYIGAGGGTYRAVMVTADAGAARPRWFAMFYYRLDPLWRSDNPPNNNHKTAVVQAGLNAYDGVAYSYDNYRGQNPESVEYPKFGYHGVPVSCASTNAADYPPTNSPRTDWVHYEERIANDSALGFKNLYIDNSVGMRFIVNCPNWFSNQGGEWANGIRTFTVGGYYRWATNINDTSTYRGDSNHFRYFDDIYIDTTLSRVMLANSPTYETATIVEPQPPVSWSDSSITVKVNRGRLAGAQGLYLFVFDADDRHNAVGLPLASDPPPAPPRLYRR